MDSEDIGNIQLKQLSASPSLKERRISDWEELLSGLQSSLLQLGAGVETLQVLDTIYDLAVHNEETIERYDFRIQNEQGGQSETESTPIVGRKNTLP